MAGNTITTDELFAELERLGVLSDGNPEFRTTNELADEWGCSLRVVRDRLKMARAVGILETSRRMVRGIDGIKYPAPAYRIKRPQKPARKRK